MERLLSVSVWMEKHKKDITMIFHPSSLKSIHYPARIFKINLTKKQKMKNMEQIFMPITRMLLHKPVDISIRKMDPTERGTLDGQITKNIPKYIMN